MLTDPTKYIEYLIHDGICAGEHVLSGSRPHLTF